MNKPELYVFRLINGHYICSSYIFPLEINDALHFLRLSIDDDCQFCRINRNGTIYEYRHYNNSKITLSVYEQDSQIGD